MQITYNNKKYRYKDNQWQFLIDDDGDGGLLINNCWYTVINKDIIKEMDNFVREQKLKRICE